MDSQITQHQLEVALKKNNQELARSIVDEISETMNVIMDRIDERFNKVEKDIIDLKESHDRLLNTIDGFVKRLDEVEIEQTARDAKFERLARWAKEVSEKTGIPLPQL
jgi:phage shock protein A